MHQIRAWTKGTNHFKEFSEGLLLELEVTKSMDVHGKKTESLGLFFLLSAWQSYFAEISPSFNNSFDMFHVL